LADGTRKLVVRCGKEQFTGKTEVRFSQPTESSCTVNAKTASSRLSAKITVSAPGEFNCFSGGEMRCE
jgi:hypothetical protein